MANKRFWLGILVIALVFGTTIIGCDDSDDDSKKPEPDIPPYIPSVPDDLTGTVSITGNPTKGSVLTADTSSLDGSGTITYRWKSGDTDTNVYTTIGTNSSTYTLTANEQGKYVAVTVSREGYSGSVTSTAIFINAMTWIQATTTGFSAGANDGKFHINNVAYGNNQWVAVCNTGYVTYSTDGQTWTSVFLGTAGSAIFTDGTFSLDIYGIAYGSGKWIAVGNKGKMATSTNGSDWTEITGSPFGATQINTVIYGGGVWFAGGNNGSIAYSLNGTTWTNVTDGPFGYNDIQSIAYGNGKWIAVGANGKMYTTTSGNTGSSWTSVDVTSLFTYSVGGSSGTVQTIQTVVYASNRWIAAGGGGKMATSTDGQNWTAVAGNTFGPATIKTIAYGNSRWVAAGGQDLLGSPIGSAKIAVSKNGIDWTSIPDTSFVGSDQINGIAFGNNKWVAVSSNVKIAYAED